MHHQLILPNWVPTLLNGEPSSKAKYNTCAIEKSTVREIYSNSSLTSSSREKVRAYLLHIATMKSYMIMK